VFDRRKVAQPVASGRGQAWFRILHEVGAEPIRHACALAYASDDVPVNALKALGPHEDANPQDYFAISLDHAIWFHQPLHAEDWHLYDFAAHSFRGNRGLTLGHIFAASGEHIATVAQEVLVRRMRDKG
jgi:acyl-CoA thioesterase-2